MSEPSIQVLQERCDRLLAGQEKQDRQNDDILSSLNSLKLDLSNLNTEIVKGHQDLKEELRAENKSLYVSKEEYQPISKGRDWIIRSVIGVVTTAIAVAIGVQLK